MSVRTVVIGAGLSGLTAAHALAQRGEAVQVLEASDRAGGVVRTEREGEFLLELGPNTVRPTPALWALIDELGLSGQVLWADPRCPRFVDFAGALHAVPTSVGGLLSSRLLSPAGKWRLLAEPFVSRGQGGYETVRAFVTRRLGVEAADRLVEPFVAGIFAGSADRLSAAAAFPTLHSWEREHGSLFAGALAARRRRGGAAPAAPSRGLLTFREGLEALPRALSASLSPSLRADTPVRTLTPDGAGWRVTLDREELAVQRVVLATPAHCAHALVRSFAPDAGRALEAIPHPPLAVLHLAWEESALPRPLRGFGHLVAPSTDRRILGAVWSSSLFPDRAPAGRALFTVFLGGSRDPSALELEDAELVDAAARDLRSEGLVRGEPVPIKVTRWTRSIPQYERGHGELTAELARTERRFPGLRFAGNYRDGVSVADVIRAGLAAGSDP